LTGIVVCLAFTLLTQLLTYQQYLIYQRSEFEKVSREANLIGDRLKTSLAYSLSATKTLAFLVERYGVPADFDSIAAEILKSNKFIDALELTRKGVITHVYPLEGNKAVIGYDVLADPLRGPEALRTIAKKDLYFAGPFELKQGGPAVVGRLPIFRDNDFWGFSVVLIRFSTWLKAAGIDSTSNNGFFYQLSKRNIQTGKEDFFLPGITPTKEHYVAIDVPDGEWKLYVVPKDQSGFLTYILPFSFLGFVFSATAGLFGWHLACQPQQLRKRVTEVTAEMVAYQQSATESLQRVNRLYHFTSRINHMVVHVSSEKEMYTQVCQVAVEIGKFRMAWIGLINHSEQKMFSVSFAGFDAGYLAEITPISLKSDDIEGPVKKMVNTRSFVYFNEIATDPLMQPWAHSALDRGYRSSILLPILKFGQIVGSFNLYAPETNAFDDKEIQLLLEASNNISFALENFEKDRMRTQVEQQIQSEKMLSDSIINSMPGIFYLFNREGKFMRWNTNFEIVSGYSSHEIGKMHPLDFFPSGSKALLMQKIDDVFTSGYTEVTANFLTKDQHELPYCFNGQRVNFDGVDYLIGMGIDITDRIRAERVLLERTEEIEKLSTHLQNIREEERARIALEIHDVLGQQLTALKMDSTWLKKRVTDDSAVTERITTMLALIDDTIRTVRRISSELRPGILDDLGLVAALEWQGAEFEKNSGIVVKFETNRSDISLERNFSTNIFRIYQEALTNIARHANATQIHTILEERDGYIRLTVKDNGEGINLNATKGKVSLGLVSMKERARQFKGEVVIENVRPHGTVVTLKVPIVKQAIKIPA
jgi:PAS domain S-box-containing protein